MPWAPLFTTAGGSVNLRNSRWALFVQKSYCLSSKYRYFSPDSVTFFHPWLNAVKVNDTARCPDLSAASLLCAVASSAVLSWRGLFFSLPHGLAGSRGAQWHWWTICSVRVMPRHSQWWAAGREALWHPWASVLQAQLLCDPKYHRPKRGKSSPWPLWLVEWPFDQESVWYWESCVECAHQGGWTGANMC